MKTNILGVAGLAIIASSLFITSCKKDDVDAPVITLNGDSNVTISLQDDYVELGANAKDEKDGNLTADVSGTVDENLVGSYTITYTATDKAGNVGTATRTVNVVNDAAEYEGNFNVSEVTVGSSAPAYAYTQTITASATVNNRVTFSKFANYVNNTGIYADIIGTTLTIPSQTTGLVGNPAAVRTFNGSATAITANGMTLNYTEVTNATSSSYVATFVRQ